MGTRSRKNAAAAALCTGVIGNVIWGSSYLFTRIAQNESSPCSLPGGLRWLFFC